MEDMTVFKSFLRAQSRILKELKKALKDNDIETANKLIDELIEDAQKSLED